MRPLSLRCLADRGPHSGAGLPPGAAATEPAQVLQRRVHPQPDQQPLQRGQAAPRRGAGRHQGQAAPCPAGAVSPLGTPGCSFCFCAVCCKHVCRIFSSLPCGAANGRTLIGVPGSAGLCSEHGHYLNVDWSPPSPGLHKEGFCRLFRGSCQSRHYRCFTEAACCPRSGPVWGSSDHTGVCSWPERGYISPALMTCFLQLEMSLCPSSWELLACTSLPA